MPKSPKTYALDIFDVLGKISNKDHSFYGKLSTDEKKALQPLVVMRWLTGSSDAGQLYFLNEFVNPYVFGFSNHKELLVHLLTVCTGGQHQRYKWTKKLSKKSHATPITIKVIGEYFGYNSTHASEVLSLLSDDVIIDYAEQLGKQPDEIKLIKKELKKR